MVVVRCVVHPIDTGAHPNQPSGFRWAVMAGPGRPDDLRCCANAGWCPTIREAEAEGDQNAATAVRAMQIAGLPARYGGVTHLDHDPIPPGGDRANVLGG